MAPPASVPQLVQPPMAGEVINTEGVTTDMTSSSRLDPPVGLEQTGPLLNGPGSRKDVFSSVGGPLSKLNDHQNDAVQQAKKYAMEQSIKMVLMKQTMAHQQQQAKTLQRHQAIVLMCRVYVGSINFEVKEDTIRQAFLPFGPIRSISMSWDPLMQKHKGFAFVEYEIPEAAQLALEQMNGVIISSRNIKVGRSSNMPQAQVVIDDIQLEAKKYNRIYIASIHPDLTQDDIKSVFEAFGPITSCELAMSSVPGRHKGYCFIEYATMQAVQDAIASMNLFDLGGNYLRVGRAITPPDTKNLGPPMFGLQAMPTAAAVAAAAATAKIQALDAVATNLGLNTTDILGNPTSSASSSSGSRLGGFGPPVSAHIPPPGVVQFQQQLIVPPVGMPQPQAVQPPQVIAQPPQVMPAPVSAAPPAPPVLTAAEALAKVNIEAQAKQQEELQRKLMDGQEMSTLSQQENLSIKGKSARHLVMQKLMRSQSESLVVLLRNMVTPDEVDEELQEEVQEECSKFGEVERVIIYHEKQSEDDDAEIIVKIFVEFKEARGTKACKESLHGRYFGGRIISAEIYDQDLYEHNDLSG